MKAGAVEKRSWVGQIEQPVAVAWVSQDRATKLGLGMRQLMAMWVSLAWGWATASRRGRRHHGLASPFLFFSFFLFSFILGFSIWFWFGVFNSRFYFYIIFC